jgi:hypothetical protein
LQYHGWNYLFNNNNRAGIKNNNFNLDHSLQRKQDKEYENNNLYNNRQLIRVFRDL